MARRTLEAGRELLLDLGATASTRSRWCPWTPTRSMRRRGSSPPATPTAAASHRWSASGARSRTPAAAHQGRAERVSHHRGNFIPIMTSVAKEDVDGLHTGTLQSVLECRSAHSRSRSWPARRRPSGPERLWRRPASRVSASWGSCRARRARRRMPGTRGRPEAEDLTCSSSSTSSSSTTTCSRSFCTRSTSAA